MSKNSAAIIKSTREQINCKQPYYQTILVRFHLVPSCIPAQSRKKSNVLGGEHFDGSKGQTHIHREMQ